MLKTSLRSPRPLIGQLIGKEIPKQSNLAKQMFPMKRNYNKLVSTLALVFLKTLQVGSGREQKPYMEQENSKTRLGEQYCALLLLADGGHLKLGVNWLAFLRVYPNQTCKFTAV